MPAVRVPCFLSWVLSDPWWSITVICTELILRAAFRWRRMGTEHIPRSGPAILAANHVSGVDPFAMAWPPR